MSTQTHTHTLTQTHTLPQGTLPLLLQSDWNLCQFFFWAQAKHYFTVHYFKKFGARDREDIEIEKRGKRERSTQHSEWQITTECEIPLTAPSLNAQPDRKKNPHSFYWKCFFIWYSSPTGKHRQSIKRSQKQFQLCLCVCVYTNFRHMNELWNESAALCYLTQQRW